MDEYYPALSPDQSFLAFTAVPSPGYLYANKAAELYITPFGNAPGRGRGRAAGEAGGQHAAGLHRQESAPASTTTGRAGRRRWRRRGQKTYYWIIFSSNRYGTPPQPDATGHLVEVSQLYVAAIVVSGEFHQVSTYPAIYLYNQDSSRLNTTPAWQDFNIPIVIDKP